MSNQPQDDLIEEDFQWQNNWAKSNESNLVGEFSAICLLTARYMADVLGKDKVCTLGDTGFFRLQGIKVL